MPPKKTNAATKSKTKTVKRAAPKLGTSAKRVTTKKTKT
jgi:hypothetical protein